MASPQRSNRLSLYLAVVCGVGLPALFFTVGCGLEQIWEHSAHDELVAWGWAPGHGRAPAPGTQKEFGDLIRAWIDTGAACPPATEATR